MNVSVVISTRDRPDDLERCLASLARGTTRPLEVLVVDQSEGMATEAVCAEAAVAGLPVLRIPDGGQGLGRAQNIGWRHAKGEIVAVVDDDCVVDETWVEAIVATLAAEPAPAGLGGRVLPLPPDGERVEPVSSRTSTTPALLQQGSRPWDVGSGNNFAVRRSWLERVRGCDERLGPGTPGLGAVDMDLFYRLLRAGARLRYEPSVVVHHRRATRAGRTARRFDYGHGMGACSVLWLREGDAGGGLRVLAAWLLLRGELVARAVIAGNGRGVRDELRVLHGTLHGMLHGWRVAGEKA